MNVQKSSANPTGWKKSFLWLALAVACFHAAYASIKFPALGFFIFGYAYFLIKQDEVLSAQLKLPPARLITV